MASIYTRNGTFCVVCSYVDENGQRHQKWESYKTMAEAKKRKTEIEFQQQAGSFYVPKCKTLNELLKEYVELYGKTKWSVSAYSANMGLIRNYIQPTLGDMRLREISAHVLEKYYLQLLKTPAVRRMTDKKHKKDETMVAPPTVRKIHNLLRSAFNQAEKWDLVDKNPARYATVPKHEAKKREIWDSQTLFHAIEECKDDRLKLCLNLAFACSLRIGELLALTWDCVDITDESIALGKASIFVNKELQRVNKSNMEALEGKDVMIRFPEQGTQNKTVLVLKKPKTITSTRKVFLPKTVAEMLVAWKMEQDATAEALGSEYADYNLVIASPMGMPVESSRIRDSMNQLIDEYGLPRVCFHSLRHSSITYKLKLNGGDIKSVQGDSGHAQASMVTEQYSHILDESRRENAQLFEEAFYTGRGTETTTKAEAAPIIPPDVSEDMAIDPAMVMKLLANPDMVKMIKMLSKTLGD